MKIDDSSLKTGLLKDFLIRNDYDGLFYNLSYTELRDNYYLQNCNCRVCDMSDSFCQQGFSFNEILEYCSPGILIDDPSSNSEDGKKIGKRS